MATHIVLSSTPMWSHTRALCVLASNIVAERPITITLLAANWETTFQKVTAEVARCLAVIAGSQKAPIRVVAVGIHSVDPAGACTADTKAFPPVWHSLITGSPIKCSATGTVYPAAKKPSLVMLDGFQYQWLPTIRSTSPGLPVILWLTGFTGGLLTYCLPNDRGGFGDELRSPFTEYELQHGKPHEYSGKLTRYPGMPPMYDWEHCPQQMAHTGSLQAIESDYAKFMVEADAIATTCAAGYDGEEALDGMSAWINETNNRPTFHLGPMIPFQPGTSDFSRLALEAEVAAAPEAGAKVMHFLDNCLRTRGRQSVVYIGFGNFFWPENNPDHLWLLLQKLEEQNIPFILTHCSPMAIIPDHLRMHLENSNIGLLSPWSPQQAILSHKAVGWFITHGGAGGTMEALAQGVPMIGWPFHADQPINIAHLVHTLDVAFEFIEVRTGPLGLCPLYQSGKTPDGSLKAFERELNEIMTAMKGDVGKRKRANAERFQQKLAGAWRQGGSAHVSFLAMLDRFCPIREDSSFVQARL